MTEVLTGRPEYAVGAWLLSDTFPSRISDWSADRHLIALAHAAEQAQHPEIEHVVLKRVPVIDTRSEDEQ